MIYPHQIDHPHPTRQKSRQKACEIPITQFKANEPNLARAPSYCENLGIPMQRQKKPDKIVPRPGTITFNTIQK